MENDNFFGLKKGQDLENRAAHPHREFPGIPHLPRTEIHTVLTRIPDGLEMRADEDCYMLQTWNKNIFSLIQSNLSNTDTEGTEQSVRIREVSLLKRGHYDDVTFMTPLTVLSIH